MVLLHLDTACSGSTQVLWPMTYKAAGALSPPRVDSSTYSQINRVLLHTHAYRATLTAHHVPHLAPGEPTGCCGMGTLDFSAWTLFWLLTVDKQNIRAHQPQTEYTCLAPNPARRYLRHRTHPTYLPKPTSTKSTQRTTPRHVVIKMGKVKDKDTILKAAQENKSQRETS